MKEQTSANRRLYVVRWMIAGALFGAFFPLIAWDLAVAESGPLTFAELHALHPTMWIFDLAPTAMGFAGTVIGVLYMRLADAKSRTEEVAREIAASWTTDLHTANLELAEVLDTRSTFYAAVTHEFRSPLTTILGYTDMAEELAYEPPELTGYLAEIFGSANAMLGMVNDLLDAAKLDSGGIAIEMAHVSCDEAIQDVVRRLTPLARQKGLSLLAPLDNAASCRADTVRLRQILTNVVANAIKYSETGTIEIRASEANGTTTIEVKDQGVGINTQDLATIFDAFDSGSSGSGRRDSSGLGLAISRSLIEAMDGAITAHSAGPGRGSTFRLTLQAPNGQGKETRKATLNTASPSTKRRWSP